MRGARISYVIGHPEYIPQSAQRLFEEWGSVRGEKTPKDRAETLDTQMNRDKWPIAWVAYANGQRLGRAALRVQDLEGPEDLTPWLGGVFVITFAWSSIGAALSAAVEDEARLRATHSLYLRVTEVFAGFSVDLEHPHGGLA